MQNSCCIFNLYRQMVFVVFVLSFRQLFQEVSVASNIGIIRLLSVFIDYFSFTGVSFTYSC